MKIAVAQITGRIGQIEANRAASRVAIEEAAAAGAGLVVLPELIVSGYTVEPDVLQGAAEPLQGGTLDLWSGLARRHGIHVAGGFCERDGDRLYNSAILVGPDGLRIHYRKLHLFDREKDVFTPGDKGLPVAETPVGRIGLCVCYDLRFVEVLRGLALAGAEIAAVPTAWVGGFDRTPRPPGTMIGQAQGAVLQANLDQIFVACASQAGTEAGTRFLGSSLVVDPFGTILAGPLDEDRPSMIVAEVDVARVRSAQERSERIRPRADRRTDVYGLRVGTECH
ncbi:nitrilase-related carbon-nitrogen hydrolase [Methylorubrum zatmanii]